MNLFATSRDPAEAAAARDRWQSAGIILKKGVYKPRQSGYTDCID